MSKKDSRVDTYIGKAQPFARPILTYIRRTVHETCPEVEETIKWGFPHFEYKGILCSMAAFKQHCALLFWNGASMSDPYRLFTNVSMGDFGKIQRLEDLPSDAILREYLHEAIQLNEAGVKRPKPEAASHKKLEEPEYFVKALQKNAAARKTYESFSHTNKKEYLEWVTDAKTEETRAKRLATALEWMAEGKIRNWKYVKK